MDFISNIWKSTTKGPSEEGNTAPEPAKAPEAATDNGAASLPKQPSSASVNSGSTGGPDSNAPPTPESPKKEPSDSDAKTSYGIPNIENVTQVSQKAVESAKSLGNFLFSVGNKAAKSVTSTVSEVGASVGAAGASVTHTVTETAKQLKTTIEENSILGDFNREQDAFTKSKQKGDVGALPWMGCDDEEAVKEQIISLSQDQRTFVRNPPAGVTFEYDEEAYTPVATQLLKIDPQLEKMRFDLVPRLIPERDFWRNYFYRVSLVKQSTQLNSMSNTSKGNGGGSSSSDTSTASGPHTPSDDGKGDDGVSGSAPDEFASDAYSGKTNVIDDEMKRGMAALGLDKTTTAAAPPKDDVDFEQELAKELESYEVVADGGTIDLGNEDDLENEIKSLLSAAK